MNSFFYTSATGRIALILIGLEILLPYLLRRTHLSESLGIAQSYTRPYLQRMWPHYWAGYLLLILSLAHAWIPMAAGRMPTTSLTGLWLATLALALLFFQLFLGLTLQTAGETRRFLRVAHFWTMLVVSVPVLAHVYLNSSLILMRTVRLGSWLFPRSFIL